MSDNDFMTMRDIGKLFGKTSHTIGRTLKELGLRTEAGKPSRQAFEAGQCNQRWTQDRMNYCWAWKREETIRLLQEHGFGKSKAKEQASSASSRDEVGRKRTA